MGSAARIALFVASLSATNSLATPIPFLTQLMGHKPQGKTIACFARTYDASWLAAHPGQNISNAHVLAVSYENHDFALQLRLGFRLRDRPEIFSSVGECGTNASLSRGARCSGLGRRIWIALKGKTAVLLNFPDGIDLWRPGPPDPGHELKGAFGPDDKLFRLDRADLAQCADQMFEDEKKALLGDGR